MGLALLAPAEAAAKGPNLQSGLISSWSAHMLSTGHVSTHDETCQHKGGVVRIHCQAHHAQPVLTFSGTHSCTHLGCWQDTQSCNPAAQFSTLMQAAHHGPTAFLPVWLLVASCCRMA